MFPLLLSLALSQTPAHQALDELERQTVPLRQPTKVVSLPVEALLKDGWSEPEAARIASAASSLPVRSVVMAVTSGVVLVVGGSASAALDQPSSAWVGVTSSLVSFAVLTLGVLWASIPVIDLFALSEPRDRRLRKAAVSASDWDPAVVRAASQLIGLGEREGTVEFVRAEQVVTEEELARLSPDPVEHTRARERMKGGATAAAILMVVGGLLLCAPPAILGATNLSPLGDLAVSLGSVGLSLVALLTAGPLATSAAAQEAAMLDRFNAAVFDEARRSLAARAAPVPSPNPE
ncbi:MAG: hypothetical protein GQE15_41480 [Archangiaceae bacterium]|nr:hypothetical protein [Archangiaceae bacterium]